MGLYVDIKDAIVDILEAITGDGEVLAEIHEREVPAEEYPAAYVIIGGVGKESSFDTASNYTTITCSVIVISRSITSDDENDAFLDACYAVLDALRSQDNITLGGVVDQMKVAPVINIEYSNADNEPLAKMIIGLEVSKRVMIT